MGEYVNVVFGSTSIVFEQFTGLLLIMRYYYHKIGEYINSDHSSQQTSDQ